MARTKSYNDIKRQMDRLQNSRFARTAERIGNRYLSEARSASYWESSYRQPGTEGYFDGKYYGRDKDKKLSRSTYSGKSDARFYADELRRSGRIPKSAYKQSEAIRNGGTSTMKDYLKGQTGAVSIGSPKSFWDHYIDGFSNTNGKLYARVYAQGDDTDTTDFVLIDDIERGRANVYLNESFRNGYSHRKTFNVTKSDLDDARKRLADTIQKQEELNYAQRQIDRKARSGITSPIASGVNRRKASVIAKANGGKG